MLIKLEYNLIMQQDLAGVDHIKFDPSIFPEPSLDLAKVKDAIQDVCSEWYSLAVQLDISYKTRKVC